MLSFLRGKEGSPAPLGRRKEYGSTERVSVGFLLCSGGLSAALRGIVRGLDELSKLRQVAAVGDEDDEDL